MNNNIVWTVEGSIKEGTRSAYEELMSEMVADVRREEGTTNYEWTIAEDGVGVHVYERYQNAEEAVKHLVTWSKYADRYLSLVEVAKFTVYSKLTAELEAAVAGLNPVFMEPIGGFSK